MDSLRSSLPNLHYLFGAYLHQDWTIEGETLSQVFEQNEDLQNRSKGIQAEAKALLQGGYENQYLDDIFFGQWQAGYEPDAEGFEDWHTVLREIIRYTGRYLMQR